jgi:hypothetical protein
VQRKFFRFFTAFLSFIFSNLSIFSLRYWNVYKKEFFRNRFKKKKKKLVKIKIKKKRNKIKLFNLLKKRSKFHFFTNTYLKIYYSNMKRKSWLRFKKRKNLTNTGSTKEYKKIHSRRSTKYWRKLTNHLITLLPFKNRIITTKKMVIINNQLYKHKIKIKIKSGDYY